MKGSASMQSLMMIVAMILILVIFGAIVFNSRIKEITMAFEEINLMKTKNTFSLVGKSLDSTWGISSVQSVFRAGEEGLGCRANGKELYWYSMNPSKSRRMQLPDAGKKEGGGNPDICLPQDINVANYFKSSFEDYTNVPGSGGNGDEWCQALAKQEKKSAPEIFSCVNIAKETPYKGCTSGTGIGWCVPGVVKCCVPVSPSPACDTVEACKNYEAAYCSGTKDVREAEKKILEDKDEIIKLTRIEQLNGVFWKTEGDASCKEKSSIYCFCLNPLSGADTRTGADADVDVNAVSIKLNPFSRYVWLSYSGFKNDVATTVKASAGNTEISSALFSEYTVSTRFKELVKSGWSVAGAAMQLNEDVYGGKIAFESEGQIVSLVSSRLESSKINLGGAAVSGQTIAGIKTVAGVKAAMEHASKNAVMKRKCACGSACTQYAEWIVKYAGLYSIDPMLVVSVMMQESSCTQGSASSSGAKGLMQIVSWSMCKPVDINSADDIAGTGNEENNIKCGIYILKEKYEESKDGEYFEGCAKRHIFYEGWDAAVRGYNGWGCDPSYPEQDYYVDEVMKRYNELKGSSVTEDSITTHIEPKFEFKISGGGSPILSARQGIWLHYDAEVKVIEAPAGARAEECKAIPDDFEALFDKSLLESIWDALGGNHIDDYIENPEYFFAAMAQFTSWNEEYNDGGMTGLLGVPSSHAEAYCKELDKDKSKKLSADEMDALYKKETNVRCGLSIMKKLMDEINVYGKWTSDAEKADRAKFALAAYWSDLEAVKGAMASGNNYEISKSSLPQAARNYADSVWRYYEEYRRACSSWSSGMAFKWPVPSSSVISRCFWYKSGYYYCADGRHTGLDISAPDGTTLVAAANGKVIFASSSCSLPSGEGGGSRYAGCVKIMHQGSGGVFYTFYAHLSDIEDKFLAASRENPMDVAEGDVIGKVGHGHLHLELRAGPTGGYCNSGGKIMNPCLMFPEACAAVGAGAGARENCLNPGEGGELITPIESAEFSGFYEKEVLLDGGGTDFVSAPVVLKFRIDDWLPVVDCKKTPGKTFTLNGKNYECLNGAVQEISE